MEQNSIKAIRSIETGRGLQAVLNEGYRIMGCPILMHDMEYHLVAAAPGVAMDDPIWNEYISTGTVKKETLEFFKDESFIDAAANTKFITVLRSKKLKYDRIYGKLFNAEQVQIGCACMVLSSNTLPGHDVFEVFCQKVNQELASIEFFTEYGQRYQNFLIAHLIESDITDKHIFEAHIESIYHGLKGTLALGLLDIPASGLQQQSPDSSAADEYLMLLKHCFPQFKYSVYQNRVLILLSCEKSSDMQENLAPMAEFFKKHHLYMGMSESFENLFELDYYYRQAVSALAQHNK